MRWPHAIRHWLARILAVLALGNLLCVQTAQADVNGQLNSFFSNLGGAANATGPVAYNGQQGGYYSGGNLWVRFPAQTTYQLGSLQMPSVKAAAAASTFSPAAFPSSTPTRSSRP
jgi:conjugative transfer pilus assembly protein TraH